MAITATRIFPKGPEILPSGGGLVDEVWQVTFDGTQGSVVITAQTLRYVVYASCAGSTNNIVDNNTSKTVTFTWTYTANNGPTNGQTAQAVLTGKV